MVKYSKLAAVISLIVLLSMYSSCVLASPRASFSIDGVAQIAAYYPKEFRSCTSFDVTLTVKAVSDVNIDYLKVEIWAIDDCCGTRLLCGATLLEDLALSACEEKTKTISCQYCPRVCKDPYFLLKVYVNLTEDGNYTLYSFTAVMGSVRDLTYSQLYSKYSNMLEEYENLKENYESLLEEYENLYNDYYLLNATYREKEQAYEELVSSYEQLREAYTNLYGDFTNLNGTLRQLENDYCYLRGKYEELLKQYEEAYRDLSYYKGRYEELKEKYEELYRKYSTATMDLSKTRELLIVLAASLVALLALSFVFIKYRRGVPQPPPPPPSE